MMKITATLIFCACLLGVTRANNHHHDENRVDQCLLESDKEVFNEGRNSIEQQEGLMLEIDGHQTNQDDMVILTANQPHVLKISSSSSSSSSSNELFRGFLLRLLTTEEHHDSTTFSILYKNAEEQVQLSQVCESREDQSLIHKNDSNDAKDQILGMLQVNVENEGGGDTRASLEIALETESGWVVSTYELVVFVSSPSETQLEKKTNRQLQPTVIAPPEVRAILERANEFARNQQYWLELFENGNVDDGIPVGRQFYGMLLFPSPAFNRLWRAVWQGKDFFDGGLWNFVFGLQGMNAAVSIEASAYDGNDVILVDYEAWDPVIGNLSPCPFCQDELRYIPDFGETGVLLGRAFPFDAFVLGFWFLLVPAPE